MKESGLGQERRRQILDAAMKCFARRGFHQATMQDICKEVQLSPGSLYRYYRSKEEIIRALVEEYGGLVVEQIREVSAEPDFYEGLLRVFRDVFAEDVALEMSVLQVEIWAEVLRNRELAELAKKSEEEITDTLATAVKLAQEKQEVDATLDPYVTATLLVALVDGLGIRRDLNPSVRNRVDAAVLRTFLRRLLQPAKEV